MSTVPGKLLLLHVVTILGISTSFPLSDCAKMRLPAGDGQTQNHSYFQVSYSQVFLKGAQLKSLSEKRLLLLHM